MINISHTFEEKLCSHTSTTLEDNGMINLKEINNAEEGLKRRIFKYDSHRENANKIALSEHANIAMSRAINPINLSIVPPSNLNEHRDTSTGIHRNDFRHKTEPCTIFTKIKHRHRTIRKKKPAREKKNVSFKETDLVTVIDVESYKIYNGQNTFAERPKDNCDCSCSCTVF